MKTILSLCDASGNWSRPYRDAGYVVHQVDLTLGQDIRVFRWDGGLVHGVLAAPPCTAFARSGSWTWPEKDRDGRTFEGIALVDACLRIILLTQPTWWVLENPKGRLRCWLGPPAYTFHPSDYGDPYTKETLLWGTFTPPRRRHLRPEPGRGWDRRGSRAVPPVRHNVIGDQARPKRGVTPMGFAQAFYAANP